MLIEQIIEFEWRGLGPLDRTCKYLQSLTPNAKS